MLWNNSTGRTADEPGRPGSGRAVSVLLFCHIHESSFPFPPLGQDGFGRSGGGYSSVCRHCYLANGLGGGELPALLINTNEHESSAVGH